MNSIPELKNCMYILECSNGKYYVGSTKNLKKRIQDHVNGKGANYTKNYPPIKLLYYEKFERIDDAFYREKQIKKWSRSKKEALFNGNVKMLHELSICQNESHYKNKKS